MTDYQEQPQPVENNNSFIADLVIADMKARKELGIKRYAVALQAFNGRDALQDLYEEQLDQIIYTKQWMVEKEGIKKHLKKLADDLHRLDYSEILIQLKNILFKFN